MLFVVGIDFGTFFILAICYSASFPHCGLLLYLVVCLVVFTLLRKRTKHNIATVLDFSELRFTPAVCSSAFTSLAFNSSCGLLLIAVCTLLRFGPCSYLA